MDPVVVVVNGREYPFVMEGDLTLGESADVEEITGQGYDLSEMGARGFAALTYVSVRRVDASVTIEDIRALTADDIALKVPEGDAVPPPSSEGSDESAPPSTDDSQNGSDDPPEAPPEVSGTPV